MCWLITHSSVLSVSTWVYLAVRTAIFQAISQSSSSLVMVWICLSASGKQTAAFAGACVCVYFPIENQSQVLSSRYTWGPGGTISGSKSEGFLARFVHANKEFDCAVSLLCRVCSILKEELSVWNLIIWDRLINPSGNRSKLWQEGKCRGLSEGLKWLVKPLEANHRKKKNPTD